MLIELLLAGASTLRRVASSSRRLFLLLPTQVTLPTLRWSRRISS